MSNTKEDIENRKNKLNNFLFGWIEDNYDKIFLVILILAFAIRFWIFLQTRDQAIWWDTATYLSTAKRWAFGLGMNDIWYYRRAFLWALIPAIIFKLNLGEGGIRFLEVIFSTGIVFVSYFLIKNMFNKKLALLTSIGLTFSWVFLFFTGRPMTSIPASFFLLTALLFFWKGYVLKQGNKFTYLFALFLGLAVLTRFQYLMFTLPLFLFILAKEKFSFIKNKSLWISLLLFVCVLIPHMVLYSIKYKTFFLIDILGHYFGIGSDPTVTAAAAKTSFISFFNYFLDLPYLLTKIVFVIFLIGAFIFFLDLFLGLDKIFKDKEVQKKLFVFLMIVIPYVILGKITQYVEQRYVMALLPFLFLMVATTFEKIEDFFKKQNKNIVLFLVLLLLVLSLIPNILWAKSLIENKSTSYLEVKQAGLWVKANSNQGDYIVTTSFPQISYYSERPISTFETEGDPEMGTPRNKTQFEEFVERDRPVFLIISGFQPHPEWVNGYIEDNKDWIIPVKAYPENQQPLIVIYKFDYSSRNNLNYSLINTV